MASILNDSAKILLIKVIGAMVSLVFTASLTRFLGANESGIYFLSLSIVMIIIPLITFGSENYLLKNSSILYVSNSLIKLSKLVFTIFSFSSFIAVSVYLFIFYFSDHFITTIFNKPEIIEPLKALALAALPLALISMISNILQGVGRIVVAFFLGGPLSNILALLFIYTFDVSNASEAATIFLLAVVITAIICLIFLKYYCTISLSGFCKLIPIVTAATPLLLIQLSSQINSLSGQLLLGVFSEVDSVAYYSVAFRVSLVISFVLIAVNKVVARDFAILYSSGEIVKLKQLVKISSRIMISFSIPALFFLFFYAESLLSVFGDDFINASTCLRIMVFGQLINVFTGSVGYLLQMTGFEKLMQKGVLLIMLFCLLLGTILIYFYNEIGASITMVISVGATNLYCWYLVNKKLNINTLKVWWSND